MWNPDASTHHRMHPDNRKMCNNCLRNEKIVHANASWRPVVWSCKKTGHYFPQRCASTCLSLKLHKLLSSWASLKKSKSSWSRVLTCVCRDVSLQEDVSLQRSVSLVNVWCTVLTSACVVPKTASSSRASVVICKWCARKWCAIVWGRSALRRW